MRRVSFVVLFLMFVALIATASPSVFTKVEYKYEDICDSVAIEEGFSIINGVKCDLNTLDVKFEETRTRANTDAGSKVGGKIELRYKRDLMISEKLSHSLRLGIGDKLASDSIIFWTIEPGVKLIVCKKVALNVSVQLRDAFKNDKQAYRTANVKYGPSINLGKYDLTMLLFNKRGDTDSDGTELQLGYKF